MSGRRTSSKNFSAWEASHSAAKTSDTPLVSVVMPAYNHARFVGEAIASVAGQAYPNLEFVIVDDGSTDGTAEIIAREIEGLSFPVRFVARENRGAPAALNEGAAMASGKYLSFLNSDDYYAPDRVAALVDGVARAGLAWGFTLVAQVAEGQPQSAAGEAASTPAGSYWQVQRSLLGSDSNSFALVQNNVAVSTGNLFVEREFFRALGGFRDLRYNHDWDFCLRAAAWRSRWSSAVRCISIARTAPTRSRSRRRGRPPRRTRCWATSSRRRSPALRLAPTRSRRNGRRTARCC